MNEMEYLRRCLTDSAIYVNCCNCRHNSDHIKQDGTCLSCVNRARFEPSRLAEEELNLILKNYEHIRLRGEVCK